MEGGEEVAGLFEVDSAMVAGTSLHPPTHSIHSPHLSPNHPPTHFLTTHSRRR